jgi:DNA-binding NtrC family response regulator
VARPPQDAGQPQGRRDGMTASILLIDDDGSVLATMDAILSSMGYRIVTASDGAVGLRLFRGEPFDLVITDVIMPGTEGIETIREMRCLRPEAKIIAMSGGGLMGRNDVLRLASRIGAVETLAKPFEAHQLEELVARNLPRERGSRAGGPDGGPSPIDAVHR